MTKSAVDGGKSAVGNQDYKKDLQSKITADGIVLLAKQPGLTSFSSLRNVKKALNTTKVGHTGTLDSFAQGLLVVCTGRLTKLAGRITEFDKTYEAVIKFGVETDTCEYTGNVVKTAPLPKEEDLRRAVEKWTGEIMQKPPIFSAIHIDGKRASDLARSGKSVEIPSRKVTVYSAEIKELRFAEKGDATKNVDFQSEKAFFAGDNFSMQTGSLVGVEYAHIIFSVSKGTYIRSLARDIAESCGSAAHLVGLYRTKVGSFSIEDAAGFALLNEFNIENAISTEVELKKISDNDNLEEKAEEKKDGDVTRNLVQKSPKENEIDEKIQSEIILKKQTLTMESAKLCGFEIVRLKNQSSLERFKNGKPLKSELFEKSLWDFPNESEIAVFYEENFCGMIHKNSEGRVSYSFVIKATL